jgi:cell division protein FtsX
VVQKLRNITLYTRIGGAIAFSVLSLTSILVLIVIIGLRIANRKTEIENLSLLGAGKWFIQAPIILEAIHYVIFGALSGWLVSAVLVMYSTPTIFKYFGEIPILPHDTAMFFALLAAILLCELILGILMALLASFIAVSRSLKLHK